MGGRVGQMTMKKLRRGRGGQPNDYVDIFACAPAQCLVESIRDDLIKRLMVLFWCYYFFTPELLLLFLSGELFALSMIPDFAFNIVRPKICCFFKNSWVNILNELYSFDKEKSVLIFLSKMVLTISIYECLRGHSKTKPRKGKSGWKLYSSRHFRYLIGYGVPNVP